MTSEQSWTLEFCDAQLEHDYQRWHHAEYGPSVQSGLAVSNFLYLIISLGFDGWSRSYDPEVSSTGLPDELLIITDLLTGILLTICFALSFTSCAADRPNLFSAIVLLLTLFLIAMRAYVIALSNSASFTAIAPVVTVVMIVCFLLGVALLQMPFVATLTVGLLTMAAYGSLALLEIGRIAPDGSGWYPIALAGATFAAALHARQLEAMRRRLFVSCPPHAQIHAQQHAQMHAQQHAQIHAQQHAQVHAQRLGQGSHPRAAGRLGAFARASSRTAELDQPAAAAVAQSDVAQSDIAQSDVAQSDASLPVADEGEEEGMRGWGPLLASDAMGGTVAGEAETAPDLAEATEAALSAADVGCSGGLRAQAFSSINSDNSQPEPSHSAGLFDSSLVPGMRLEPRAAAEKAVGSFGGADPARGHVRGPPWLLPGWGGPISTRARPELDPISALSPRGSTHTPTTARRAWLDQAHSQRATGARAGRQQQRRHSARAHFERRGAARTLRDGRALAPSVYGARDVGTSWIAPYRLGFALDGRMMALVNYHLGIITSGLPSRPT